jgi:hypothetical protein
MDLNELLYAHQVEVMKASACVDDDHIARIAEYAAQIRQLRTLSTATPIAQDPSAPPILIYSSYAGNSTEEGCVQPPSPSATRPTMVLAKRVRIRTGDERTPDSVGATARQHDFAARLFNQTAGGPTMAKGQKRSNREVRKPKAEKQKSNASQPSLKPGSVKGLENLKNS